MVAGDRAPTLGGNETFGYLFQHGEVSIVRACGCGKLAKRNGCVANIWSTSDIGIDVQNHVLH